MCLTYDRNATEKFWNTKYRKGKTWCWAYKFLGSIDGDVVTAVMSFFQTGVNAGWIKSNRNKQEPGEDRDDFDASKYNYNGTYYNHLEIHCGTHVTSRSQTLASWRKKIEDHNKRSWNLTSPLCLVRVKCYKKDFVAADENGNAVFMKVFLPKTEYNKVLKK